MDASGAYNVGEILIRPLAHLGFHMAKGRPPATMPWPPVCCFSIFVQVEGYQKKALLWDLSGTFGNQQAVFASRHKWIP